MTGYSPLFFIRILILKNQFQKILSTGKKRVFTLILMGGIFWTAIFGLTWRILVYFQSIDAFGDILAKQLLYMILLTFFSLLVFSNIITALSNLFLSHDLEFCHATPLAIEDIFLSRFIYTMIDSSWMVIIFGLPIMLVYGIVYNADFIYYFTIIFTSVPLILISSATGVLIIQFIVIIFPAHRTRDVVILFLIFFVIAVFLMFRFLKPEKLINPESFQSLLAYISAIKGTDSVFLPSYWAGEALWEKLMKINKNGILFIAQLWSTALALIWLNIFTAKHLYFNSFSKSQEGARRKKKSRSLPEFIVSIITLPFKQDMKGLIAKDIRSFFRDHTQWSQLFLLGALVVIYIFNFKVIPIEGSLIRTFYLQNILAFLNLGLAGFVISAICVRFVFPAISIEGKAFWIIRNSPFTIKRFLIGKFIIYLIPMLLLSEILIVYTNYLLDVTFFMMVLSTITIFFMVFGIVALGIGFGALYPDFNHQNIAQVSTSFGGVIYMISSILFMGMIIILEAGPTYIIITAQIKGTQISMISWVWIYFSFTIALLINIIAIFFPFKIGLKSLLDCKE